MPSIREGIYDLLGSVEVDTKEMGRTHVEPWLSQRMVIDTVANGLENDVHTFCILKCRQVAITTAASVIELFWALANPGTQGAIIADRTDNLERLRRIFASLLETLPPEWRGPEHQIITNNRNGMVFANRSVIDLMAAANNPDLGASRALNMLHATECGTWRSLAGVESLKASLAQLNPNRLYLFESIANGFNWWYHYCMQAKQDRHMRFVFCGFWSNPTYSIPRDNPDYRTYWDGHLTDEEIKKARLVRGEYGVTVTPEQVAWWRRESEYRAEEYMLRHFPWHEKECFIASGSHFFPAQRTLEIGEALAHGAPYKGYKYVFDERFLSSRIEQTTDTDEANLRVWEPPVPGGVYTIGIDPSGGGGGESDDHAIQVLRCYANRVVQVCEFQSNKPLTYQLAWVLAHLAGAYRDHMANLEITGIGAAVMPEVRNLRQLAERGLIQGNPTSEKITDIIGNVRWFLYSRVDTMGGAGNVINWKTNQDNKSMIYSELRDSLMLRRLEIRSLRLVQQMQAIVDDEGWIGAGPDTGEQDDLVSALVLAHHAWVKWKRDGLVARNYTWESVHERPPDKPEDVLMRVFSRHFQMINQKSQRRHQIF
ncbi:MAG TPA: hypothetical protein VGH47_15900 [Xanthobacteraceae bacterium]|jgi:hypothetical protein